MANNCELMIGVDRDSVCAGDDCESHDATIRVSKDESVLALLAAAWEACPLANIQGGKATWLIQVGDDRRIIGVMAEQWDRPKLFVSDNTTTAQILDGKMPALFFKYDCQSDPDVVFALLQAGRPLSGP
jgi:hypothetical protein